MKITVDRKMILPTLNLVSSVVEGKEGTLPMLSNLYFNLKDGVLDVVGTDMEMEISQAVSGVQGDNGEFTVSTKKFHDIVRILPENASISIKQDKNDRVVITAGRSRYVLRTLPAKEFPRIVAANWEERLKIRQSALVELLEKTAFAMAVSDVRYYLNGVLFQFTSKQLRSIATDGHRLAQSDMDTDLDVKEMRELIIPRKAVQAINRFIGGGDAGEDGDDEGDGDGGAAAADEDAELTLEMNQNHLKLTRDNTVLITKLIDGKFPEYKGVLEHKFELIVGAARQNLIDTLSRVAVLTSKNHRGVKIHLGKNEMKITTSNQEQEEAEDQMEVKYSGKTVENGYNVDYLIDVARACRGDTIELHLQESEGICILKQPDDERTIWLVMPMRL